MKYQSLILSIILLAALSRVLPHPDNVSPVAAMALFAGAYVSNRLLAFALPLAAMFLSDAILGFDIDSPYVYVAFALTVGMGFLLQNRKRALPVLGASLAASILFFLITNFGTWMSSGMYPHSVNGLAQAYAAGIPFLRNTLLGDLFYVTILFGGMALSARKAEKTVMGVSQTN